MYDRTKYLKLTNFEACQIGIRAATYVGIPKREVDLFGAVFDIMIESYLKRLQENTPTEESPSGKKPSILASIEAIPLP